MLALPTGSAFEARWCNAEIKKSICTLDWNLIKNKINCEKSK